jgi:uncharacterized membrane protein YphA (DoxX/SURF4 family)
MDIISILQVIVALGLLNVWMLRGTKATAFRGGDAKSLKEEFKTYGLPKWFYYLIGALKIGSALALLAGLWNASLALGAAVLITFLMLGALAMHLKVRDPLKKSIPAFIVLVLSLTIFSSLFWA